MMHHKVGDVTPVLHVALLGQMVLQARWHTDSPLTTLPGVAADHLPLFRHRNGRPVHALPELQHAVAGDYRVLEQVRGC